MLFFLYSFLLVLLIVGTWVSVANLCRWIQIDVAFKGRFFLVFISSVALALLPLLLSLILHLFECLSLLIPKKLNHSIQSEDQVDITPKVSVFQRALCCNFPFHKYPHLDPFRLFALAFPCATLWIAACSVYYVTLSLVDFSTISVLFQINGQLY